MPDTREFQSNALTSSANTSPEEHNLNEAMRRIKIDDVYEDLDAYSNPYPDRPGEPDCPYYMKTGSCGYGSICRYNHPTYAGQGSRAKGELPERVGQPDCQYFLKTGTCKFGSTCKYHHPRDRQDARTVPLNILGYPMRLDEKSCPYYMRTGTCKFGFACKFNHPQPATVGAVYPLTGSSAYGSAISSVMPPSMPLPGGISPWSLPNRPPYMSSARMQGLPAFMPVILPSTPGTMPVQQGWSTYTGSVGPLPSSDIAGHSPAFKSKNNQYPSPSGPEKFPERPDQPECQYFLKTGSCKYGPTCKYNHPREGIPSAASALGPFGLPLRPGEAVCSFYSMYGTCRFGPTCRYDHPLIGYYNYTVPASIPNHAGLFPNQRDEARDEFRNRTARVCSPSRTAVSSDSLLNQSD